MKKTTTGFDLLIGKYYQDTYFRADEPLTLQSPCPKCESAHRELFHLKKLIFAFGRIIIKHKQFYVCLNCLHEEELEAFPKTSSEGSKSPKSRLLTAFKSLTPEQQKQLLGG